MKKRIISLLLVCMMIFSLLPTAVFAADGTETSGYEWDTLTFIRTNDETPLTEGTDYTVNHKTYNTLNGPIPYYNEYFITTAEPITISGGGSYARDSYTTWKCTVEMKSNANSQVTLKDVTCLGTLTAQTGYTMNVTLEGTNNVDSIIGSDGASQQTSLVFGGTGTLNGKHIGGASPYGTGTTSADITIDSGTYNLNVGSDRYAAIGGGYSGSKSVKSYADGITINGGTINAKGGYGAAIGGGQYGDAKNITITGGKIVATGSYGAGIGSGMGQDDSSEASKLNMAENITITGGDVTAVGGSGAAIGGGSNAGTKNITISGGTVNASTASQSAYAGAAIGGGAPWTPNYSYTEWVYPTTENITISGGTVTASAQGTTSYGKVYIGHAVGYGTFNNTGSNFKSDTAANVGICCGVYMGKALDSSFIASDYSAFELSANTYIIGKTGTVEVVNGKVVKGTFAFDVTENEYVSDTSTVTEEDGAWKVTPPTVNIGGETGTTAEVTVEQAYEVDMTSNSVAQEIKELDDTTKEAITTNTSVSGVNLTTEAAAEAPDGTESGLQAVVNAAIEQNMELAAAIAEAETVNIEVKVDVIPKEFKKSADASESAPETIGTVTFELKPTATVTVGEGSNAKSETVDVDNSMIDTSKPITVSIYTGFEPVKIVHSGDNGFEEVFRKTGEKTFTYNNGVCTLTINHFSELTAVAKVYVAQTGEEKQYETLQTAVDNASTDATTITLLDDVVLTTGVNIPEGRNITVNGQNHTITIDASASQYVFGNGTVSTEGLKGTSELTVNNVNFVSSTKGQNYGVITGSGFKGKVSLNNCSFKDMYTAVYMNPNGAEEAELSITNCEYDNTTWGYSVDTVSSPGSDKVNVKTTFTGNNIDATKTFEIFGVAAIYEDGKQIGQYNTLAAAMTAVASGENKVITILPGTIKIGPTETLTLASADITLKGIRGDSNEYLSKIIRDQIPSGNNMFIYVNAANITLEDIYIEYATTDDAWNQRNRPILTSAAADNFTMKNCYLKGPDKANMLLNPGDGADNGLIEGNTFEGGSSGIYIRPCSGTQIKNNTFINNGTCITFEPENTTGFQNMQVSGNTFNINRSGGLVGNPSRGNTQDYASTIGIKIFPEVANTTNQGWGEGNVISENTFVNNTGETTYAAYAVIPRSGANDGYTNELIDRISDSFKTNNILPAGALMGYKEVGTTNAATQFSPIVEVAQINGTKYFSLASAIKAAGETDTIKLVKDVTIAAPVNVTKALSIDGNNFTLSLTSGKAIFNGVGNNGTEGISESLTVKNLNMVMNSEAPAQSGYAVIAGKGGTDFAISFENCSFTNMFCGAILNGCGTGNVAPAVTIKNSTFENVAHGVSFAVANYAGTVTFTGNKMSGETDIQEVFTTDGYVKTPTVKVTDGYYTADPTAYLASGYAVAGSDVQGYAYMVAKVDLPAGGNEKIAVTSEEPKVAENSITGIDENTQNAIKAAAVKTEVAGLATDALKEAAKVNAADAETELDGASVTVGDGDTITVFAQTYLDVKPTAYSAEDATKVYTVDIKPMVQLIATTAAKADAIITDTEDKNAVALGDPAELKVNTPVVVTIPLPADFAAVNDTLYVKHTKDNGASYLYKCAVQKDANDQLYIQFVNNNGFSEFEITTVDTSVASIVKGGSTLYYTSLSAAVAAVKDDETIKLTANCGETVTVARAVSFTLDRKGYNFSGSITPGANYKNTGSANESISSYIFTYVAPSGGGVASYAVSAASATHGKVTVDKASASAGSTVTITVAPEKGFTLETLTVKDAKGNEVALTAVKTGETYTFKMPSGKVTISATFMEDNTMLNFFVDVKADDYFYDAVLWAAKNGITLGVDDTHFAPMAITTRGQMVTFLWRAAGCPEPTSTTCAFTDVKTSEYYYKAVLWAVETGITKGTSDTTFSPDANVSRSQTVTFLARMSGVKDDAAGYSHNFADVSAADYFNNAVAWAATNKITEGTSATTFSPNDDCLRGQIVTFLYRNFVK